MIRVVVSYPSHPGSRFDLDYYLNRHIPLVIEKLRPHGLTNAEVEQGVEGGVPGAPAKYQIQAYLNFTTLGEMQSAMGAEREGLMADVPNFTDVHPELQVNQTLR